MEKTENLITLAYTSDINYNDLTTEENEKLNKFLQEISKKQEEGYLPAQDDLNKINIDLSHYKCLLLGVEFNLVKAHTCLDDYIRFREDFSAMDGPVDPLTVKNEIDDGFAYFYGRDKKGYPCLIFKVKNSIAGKNPVKDRIRHMIYLIDQANNLLKEYGVEKMCVIWDRDDFDKEKNFDNRFPSVFQGKYDKEMGYNLFERIDMVYVLNIGFFYRMLFQAAKVFMKDKLLRKVKLLGSNSDLTDYFNRFELPSEYR